jgi:DNA-directed RNA polymerase specialized sigma24 family protein
MVNFNSIYTDVDYKAYCKRLYNNRYLWEDLLQEFYIKIFNCKKKFIDETELKKYCFVVIRNLFYQKERKNSALKELANDNELTDIEDETTEYNELPDIISKHPTLGIENVKKYCYENKISYTAMKVKNHRIKKQLKLEYANIIKP